MSCTVAPAPDFCPTAEELLGQYLMMLPRGRAWGEGGAARLPGGVIYGFLYFCALIVAAYHASICALIPEFYCSTAIVTAAWWLEEYGLPDPCDPFPNPCAKIIASGGPTCANIVALAALTGLTVDCAPGPQPSSVLITIHTATPPVSDGHAQNQRLAGCYYAGQDIDCGASANPLDCLLARIVHAHVAIFYAYASP
jgi:hypothetical protein